MSSEEALSRNVWKGILRSLRHRNYRLFFFGQGISLIGTWLTRVATSWLVYRLTHSASMLGVVSFAGLLPTFLMAPFAGVLVDRWPKHRTLVITQVCACLQSALLAYLTLSAKINIPELVVLSIFQGFINAFDMPVRQSFVVQMIEDRKDLPNAIALNSSLVNLTRLIGPSFAGVLIATSGEGGCFAIDAISYLAVIATLLMMTVKPEPKKTAPQKHVLLEFKEGLQYAKGSKAIVYILGLLALISFMGMPYMTLMPMIVSQQLAGDARTLGYLTGASGLGAFIGALFLASSKEVTGMTKIIVTMAFIFGISLIFIGTSRSMWLSMPIIFFAGMGLMVQLAASNTVLQTIVDESKRGRVMSLFVMAYAGTMPFGSLFGGLLADKLGVALTLELGGAICCLGAFLFLKVLPEIQGEVTHVTPEAAPST